MTVKRAVSVLAFAVATGGIGSAIIVGTAASGAPHATLHLGTTLHLVSHPTNSVKLSSSRQVTSASLVKRSSGRPAGSAVYTCRTVSSGVLSCQSAYGLSGGVLLGEEVIDLRDDTLSGKITGGNGKYAGSSGSLKGVGRQDGGINVTVRYSG
jgi:hypothetical protein